MSSSWLSASLVLSPARDVVQLRMLLNSRWYFVRTLTVPMSCDTAVAHALERESHLFLSTVHMRLSVMHQVRIEKLCGVLQV